MNRFTVILWMATLLSGAATSPAMATGLAVINSATVDYLRKTLTINGQSLGASPTVLLNNVVFPTPLSSSSTQIVVKFPDGTLPNYVPGSYFLTVTYKNELPSVFTVDIGANGPQGAVGPMGPTGAQGIQGPQGLTGAIGLQGAQGVPGAPGPKGDPGPMGPAGTAGATGPQGAKGDTGAMGAPGLKGDTGAKGDKGDPGIAGAGLTSIADLNGISCSRLAGGAGQINVSVDSADNVGIVCSPILVYTGPPVYCNSQTPNGTTHNNGFFYAFQDCQALNTFNEAQATEAAIAWPGSSVVGVLECTVQGQIDHVLVAVTSAQSASWGFDGAIAGHVQLNQGGDPSGSDAVCPTVASSHWN